MSRATIDSSSNLNIHSSSNANIPTVRRRQHESRSPRRPSKPRNRSVAPDRRSPIEDPPYIRRPWDKDTSSTYNSPAGHVSATNQ
ncbi:hypothetical protein ACF0H5_001783 [Mactra antiquata]